MPRLREIAGPAGRLEVLLDEPESQDQEIRAAVVFAHPHPLYGGTMHTKVVYRAAKALKRIGCSVLRFNFRGTGKSEGAFDGGQGELADFRAALDFMHVRHPSSRLWAGGFSFGAWIALTSGVDDPRVTTLLGIAPPLGDYSFEAVASTRKPKFFIQGERDEICPLRQMREFYARASEPKELVVIDAADHLFDGRVTEVADAIEDLLGDWTG
jgi:uncharacterized protein